MSEVLYRKYRPQKFAEVLGQDVVKTVIQNSILTNRVFHAYLFCGPRGVGKTTIARLLAKAINCQNPQGGEPDTTCENCVQIQEGRFLDLLEIDAASYTGVDNIRDVIDHVRFAPSKGRYKVFIIDEAHMLSKSAWAALLKTLEEPPAHAIFILATTEIHKVPATIISRSQRFDFKRVALADILKLLDKILGELTVEASKEAKILIAQAAEGSFRDSLSILDQVLSFGGKSIRVEGVEEILGITRIETDQKFFDLLIEAKSEAAAALVKDMSMEGKDLIQFLRNFLEYLRLVLLVKMGVERVEELGLSAEEEIKLKDESARISGNKLTELIKKVLEAYRETKQSPVQELPLLAMIYDFTNGKEMAQKPGAEIQNSVLARSNFNLGQIIDRWAQVLAKVKDYNHSLIASLRLGRLVRLEGLDLIIAFPYNFHKETLTARKNRIVVEQVLEEVFGSPIRVKVYLERELSEGQEDLLKEAVKILGSPQSSPL